MDRNRDFQGSSGIITGAGSGIGRAAAKVLAQRGAALTLADLAFPAVEELAAEIEGSGGLKPLCLKIDVTGEADVARLVEETRAAFGRIDFLVTSAGILRRTAFAQIEPAEWDLMMAVNLRGVFLCCQAVVPAMIAQGQGVIVNVASLAGRSTSILGGAHYTAAKHAVIGLTRHMARELGPQGIRANAFCPGGTLTPMVTDTTTPEARANIAAALPLRRFGRPEEQAQVIAFLLSEESGYMTGAAVDSNGGALML